MFPWEWSSNPQESQSASWNAVNHVLVQQQLRDGPWSSHCSGLAVESESFRKVQTCIDNLTNNHRMLFYPEHMSKERYYLENMTSAQHQIYILPRIYGISITNLFVDQILHIAKGSSTLLCKQKQTNRQKHPTPTPELSVPSVISRASLKLIFQNWLLVDIYLNVTCFIKLSKHENSTEWKIPVLSNTITWYVCVNINIYLTLYTR